MELVQLAYIPLVILMASGWGLISLWATTSKLPWWVRSSSVGLLLSLFLTVPAYEPILFFALQLVTIAIGVSLPHFFRGDELGSKSFSLRSLLLAMVMAALLLSVAIRTDIPSASVWLALFFGAVSLGIATLLSSSLVQQRQWKWRTIFGALGILLGFCVPMGMWDAMLLHLPEWDRNASSLSLFRASTLPYKLFLAHFALWALVLSATYAIVAIGLRGLRGALLPSDREALNRNRPFDVFCTAFVLCLVTIPTFLVFRAIPDRLPTPQSGDGNDCYSQLLLARESFTPSPALDDYEDASDAQLSMALSKNQVAFAQMREALELPYQPNLDLKLMEMLRNAQFVRELARALVADASLAHRQGRIDDSITTLIDIIRIAHKIDDQNLMVGLVSSAIEAMGMTQLERIQEDLSPVQSQRVIDALLQIDNNATPIDEIFEADKIWAQHQWGWRTQLYDALFPFVSSDHSFEYAMDANHGARQRANTERHLLCTRLTIGLYQRNHGGSLPESLDDLNIAGQLLSDPYNADGTALKYHRQSDTDYLLYSVGPDGDDDLGARINPRSRSSYDGDLQ